MGNNLSLSKKVERKIINSIINDELLPGEKLPSEFDLAEKLNVSRSTIREAVKSLVSQNILEIKRGMGTFVCEQTGVSDDPLGFKFINNQKKLALDLYEVRLMIEPNVAKLAAERANEEDIFKLEKLADEVEYHIINDLNHGNVDIEFHTFLAKCTNNSVIPSLIPIITHSIPVFIELTNDALSYETINLHRNIVLAIKNKDPIAAFNYMEKHIKSNFKIISLIK